MNSARIIVVAIAFAAGGTALYLASVTPEAPVSAPVVQLPTIDVLVAKQDILLGQTVGPNELQRQTWPASASSGSLIKRNDRPEAPTQITGSIARSPFIAGEPIREQKLIRANGSGFMAAILPSGMRAVSTEITPETGAGGFILPNDRVDVILSKRERGQGPDGVGSSGGPELVSSRVIIANVRVLAIDQAPKEKEGQNSVVGKTATLEVSPADAEVLARARQGGTLSLALRSLADGNRAPVVQAADNEVITVYRGASAQEVLTCNPLCGK
jgi:pilus assembly protein CpaB